MLKWAMRIIAVGGALLAMAVGTAACLHRTKGRGRWWALGTPKVVLVIHATPKDFEAGGWLRREWSGDEDSWQVRRYGVESYDFCDDSYDGFAELVFTSKMLKRDFGGVWNGFGFVHGDTSARPMPSFTAVLCPTWSLIAVLLLPMTLWGGVALRQRRRVKTGHCVSCGYDLRASPERCPECGRDLKKR